MKLVLVLVLFLGACSTLTKAYNEHLADNPIEEAIEGYIEDQTGIEIEISPGNDE